MPTKEQREGKNARIEWLDSQIKYLRKYADPNSEAKKLLEEFQKEKTELEEKEKVEFS
jgi:hypothetical protein